jgi:hypothetical protein
VLESKNAARCRSKHMPQSIEVVGWEDYEGNRHEGLPNNVNDAWGVLVYAPDAHLVGRGDEHFWAFVPATTTIGTTGTTTSTPLWTIMVKRYECRP